MPSIILIEPCPLTARGEELPIRICSVLHGLMEENKFLCAAMLWVAPESNIHSGSEKEKPDVTKRVLAFSVLLLGEDKLTFMLCFFISEEKTTNFLK